MCTADGYYADGGTWDVQTNGSYGIIGLNGRDGFDCPECGCGGRKTNNLSEF